MLTFTKWQTLYQEFTKNTETSNVTLGDITLNEGNRKVLKAWSWPFLQRSANITTVASQQSYDLPFNYAKAIAISVTISSQKYTLTEITDRRTWNIINQTTSETSDIATYFFINGRKVEIYPKPSSAGNTITVDYTIRVKDLSIADYTTGTITTAPNGDETITGDSTAWTDKMANRWLRITDSDDENTGDGEWYEVASITSNTALELQETYNGPSIAAGTASYILGQISDIPEDYQILPVYFASYMYWLPKADRADKTLFFQSQYNESAKELFNRFSGRSDDPVVDEGFGHDIIRNPNLFITA